MQTPAGHSEHNSVDLLSHRIGSDTGTPPVKGFRLRIAIGPYILRGGGTTTDLLVTEMKRTGRRYLTLQSPIQVYEGDILNLIRFVGPNSGFFRLNRTVKKILGTLKVVRIVRDDRVEVLLLNGKFFGGTCVERMGSESINK